VERIFPVSSQLPGAPPGTARRATVSARRARGFGRRPRPIGLGEISGVGASPRPARHVGLRTQVYGRFSLGDRKSALISNDWVVGINTTAALGAWTVTGEIYHESSHLGDEYGNRFGASRLDWTREVASAWVSYGTGPVRVTGNLSYVLLDELDLDRPGAALAADFEGRPIGTFLGGRVRPVGGVFLEGAAATSWRISTSAKLGVAVATPSGGREIGIALIAHDGLSTQRQFFRRESRYVGAELRFDL
jgi:hypothetical protein